MKSALKSGVPLDYDCSGRKTGFSYFDMESGICPLPPRLAARKRLPSPHDHIAVSRLQFDQPCLAPGLLARDQRRAGPAEDIKHRIPALAAVAHGALHQLDRLHRRVQIVDVGLLDEPHVALVAGAAPEVVRALTPAVEDRLVLPLVVRPPHRERVLRPDYGRAPVAARLAEDALQSGDLRGRHADIE